MDTINSTLAHGPETRLPSEFYDERLREIVGKIGVEEWFHGYNENREYRALGMGAQVGDIVERMVSKVEGVGLSINEIGGENGRLGRGRGGETGIVFALSGCHDTTLAGFMSSFGAFTGQAWPPYTSHIAVELFRDRSGTYIPPRSVPAQPKQTTTHESPKVTSKPGWLASMVGLGGSATDRPEQALKTTSTTHTAAGIARRPVADLNEEEQKRLNGYYVRLRYNDRVFKIPGCAKPGNHLEGDDSFCTLEAFKRIADSFTPQNWKAECARNIDGPIPGLEVGTEQWAGQVDKGF